MKRFLQGWTVCGEMYRRGWITHPELAKDKVFLDNKLSVKMRFVYKLTIIPLVFGMKVSDDFAVMVGEIVGSGWFKKNLGINVHITRRK